MVRLAWGRIRFLLWFTNGMFAGCAWRYGEELVKCQYACFAATPPLTRKSANSIRNTGPLDAGYGMNLTLLTFVEDRVAAMIYAFFINILKLLPAPFMYAFLGHTFAVDRSEFVREGRSHDA